MSTGGQETHSGLQYKFSHGGAARLCHSVHTHLIQKELTPPRYCHLISFTATIREAEKDSVRSSALLSQWSPSAFQPLEEAELEPIHSWEATSCASRCELIKCKERTACSAAWQGGTTPTASTERAGSVLRETQAWRDPKLGTGRRNPPNASQFKAPHGWGARGQHLAPYIANRPFTWTWRCSAVCRAVLDYPL